MATIAELRDLANKEHVQLGGLTLKADIEDALVNAGVALPDEEPEEEPQAEVEGEPEVEEPEGYEYDQPQDEQPPSGTADEPVVKAGGYIATDKGWELAENVEG